eukprot:CAMPEP_0197057490 /NCGR_PEP_ID=MMETSP1384-20130603/97721_1 /TAXON_ID=29189 /ORGANISM="Ammonia sp." /LENGTH=47 /DNA_ID= /DNA_START= /DNA_END= /DNA_ORIENTATION=
MDPEMNDTQIDEEIASKMVNPTDEVDDEVTEVETMSFSKVLKQFPLS